MWLTFDPYTPYAMSPPVELCAAKRSAATLSGWNAFAGERASGLVGAVMLERP
jgi:hypothetical protein